MDNTNNNVDTKHDVKKSSADEKAADTVTGHQEIIEDALTSNESISPKHGGQDTEKSTKEDSKKIENICISKDDLLQSNSILLAKIDFLSQLFSEKIRHSEHEEKIVTQMHTELQKYKGDMYAQLIRPVLLDIIETRESILRMAATYLKKPEGEQDIPNKTFVEYAFDIQQILEKNDVEIYKSSPEDDFVPIKQRVSKKVATGNKKLHGKVAESLSCGYQYNGRPISAEKIAVYYYEEPVELITKNNEEKVENG